MIADDEVRMYLFAGNGGSGGPTNTEDTNGTDGVDEHDINRTQGIYELMNLLRAEPRVSEGEVRAFTSETGSEWDWSRNNAESYALRKIILDIQIVANRPLGIAMAGYSWGGGMLADITQRLARRRGIGQYHLATTAYIDAIDHRTHNWLRVHRDFVAPAETSMPLGTHRHLNFYQMDDDPDVPPGENQKSNYPNGSWSGGGFISVNMDVNAAVRNSPNVGRSLFAQLADPNDPESVAEKIVHDPVDLGRPNVDNQFTHSTIHKQQPILFEIVEWFISDLL